MLAIICVLGSIYGGIASVSEAAGVGVFGALFVALVCARLDWTMITLGLLLAEERCPAGRHASEIFGSVWPFIGLRIVGLVLVMYFPQIALWLPSLTGG